MILYSNEIEAMVRRYFWMLIPQKRITRPPTATTNCNLPTFIKLSTSLEVGLRSEFGLVRADGGARLDRDTDEATKGCSEMWYCKKRAIMKSDAQRCTEKKGIGKWSYIRERRERRAERYILRVSKRIFMCERGTWLDNVRTVSPYLPHAETENARTVCTRVCVCAWEKYYRTIELDSCI